jgi:hypothetical protein
MRAAIPSFVVAFALLTGCATSAPFTTTSKAPEDRTGACEQRTSEVFAITGAIDAELARCVRESFAESTRILVLNSEGGSVEAALDIATVLQGRNLTMRVERECNSSCANYFLPLAKRIEIGPEAMVLLHGSIDPWTIDRMRANKPAFMAIQARNGRTTEQAEAEFAGLISKSEALATRQAEFARAHAVAPGWMLFRMSGSDGIPGLVNHPTAVRAILVEEPMLRSCLPNVEIAPYQATLERHWTHSYRRLGLLWERIGPSGRAVCSPS